jgi:LmbE family N-acetylglucosaminyl deacetylase
MKKILIVAAHPDDEILGCGGLINQCLSNKLQVRVVIIAEGISSRYSDVENMECKDEIKKLQDDARAANRYLGDYPLFFLGLPDNRLDGLELLDIIKMIEIHKNEFMPDTVLTHHAGDLNIDHTIVNRAVLTAFRPSLQYHPQILLFEGFSASEWNYPVSFRPNYFVSLSENDLEKKIKAMSMYTSERTEQPHPRSGQIIEAAAYRWGSFCGVQAAEAYEVVRIVH